MILSHLSGIRHYEKDAKKVREAWEKCKGLLKPPVKEKDTENEDKPTTEQSSKVSRAHRKAEFEHEEYYLKDNFESVIQALDVFKDDPLIFKPGNSHINSKTI